MAIAAVINYCTNDYRFLARAIAEVRPFATQIIVPVCDHFFDGSPENRPLLECTYANHEDVLFLEFAYDVKQLYTPYVQRQTQDEDWGALWHSTARYLAFLYLSREIESILFLDADEMIEGKKFAAWLHREEGQNWDAHWFFAYCYGFQASRRAPDWQHTALLVKRSALSPLKIFSAQERFGIFAGLSGPKRLQVLGLDGNPMIHHYSWVRPMDERLKKVSTWGKRHLCNWQSWLKTAEHEMSHYEDISPYFDPLIVPIPSSSLKTALFPHVIRVNPQIAFRKELDDLY